jgi:uncharacterized membrane protein
MILQAAGLAVLASISPTALLVAAVYLGSARPRVTAGFYLTGAIVMSLVMGLVLVVVLRAANLSRPSAHAARYDFRLALGIALLVLGIGLARRHRRPADPAQSRDGFVSRMMGRPGPRSAFAVGLLVFAPGATFIAALQVIATARASVEVTAAALVLVVVINVMLVWLPIVLHVVAPEATTRYLASFNGWLRSHGRSITVGLLVVVGAILIANGIYGLIAG